MPPLGFEPTIEAGERPQNYVLEHAATGNGHLDIIKVYYSPTNAQAIVLKINNIKIYFRWALPVVFISMSKE